MAARTAVHITILCAIQGYAPQTRQQAVSAADTPRYANDYVYLVRRQERGQVKTTEVSWYAISDLGARDGLGRYDLIVDPFDTHDKCHAGRLMPCRSAMRHNI